MWAVIAILDTKRTTQLEIGERRKKKIREDLAYLGANRLMLLKTGAYTPEKLVAEELNLNMELNTLSNAEITSDVSMQETIKDAVKLSELLKDVANTYLYANPQKKDQIIKVIFSELTIFENTLQYKCRKGFQALQNRFIVLGDHNTWLSELCKQRDFIALSIKELEVLFTHNK